MIPSARDSGLSGAHIQPPDHAVAPPRVDAFSVTITSRPSCAAVTAAESPPAPPPATSRSHSTVRFVVVLPFTIEPFVVVEVGFGVPGRSLTLPSTGRRPAGNRRSD